MPNSAPSIDETVAQRLNILALARELKNVSRTCKQVGISRSRFYQIKTAFDRHGLDGLKPQPRRITVSPNRTPPELVEEIMKMTARYPTYSYGRICAKLRAASYEVVPSTVRCAWKKRGLNTRSLRLLWVQKKDSALLTAPSDAEHCMV